MIVTKFDRNPIKYVEEETDCQKEERKKELDMLPSQTAYPASFKTLTPDWPQFPCLSRKCDASVWITWIYLVI